MPASENPGSSYRLPFGSFRRAIFTLRTEQVHSLEPDPRSSSQDSDFASFQRFVSARFSDLSVANDEEFLSLPWVRKLLDAFGDCLDRFRAVLWDGPKPPQEKILSDFFETSIKALDICNAARDGIQRVRVWQGHLEIVVSALDPGQRMVGEGHFRRARKSLTDLTLAMLDDIKDTWSLFSSRNRSFGQCNKSRDRPSSRHTRSLSWSVSPSWSASKQLQLIANTLVLPNTSNALATLVFTMSHVLLCVLSAVVAAIPCQDRGVHVSVTVPTHFTWARPLQTLHSRVTDASKKRDRRNVNGSLKETYQIEKGVLQMLELFDSAQLPLSKEQKEEVGERAEKLSQVCKVYQTELGPLERQLREMFRKIRSCRAEGLEMLSKAT